MERLSFDRTEGDSEWTKGRSTFKRMTIKKFNRLTNFQVGTLTADHTAILGMPSYTWTVSPDSIGNRNTVTTNGTPTNSTFNSQNEQTHFGSNALTYDNAGDMTTDQNGNAIYDYDAWGRL